VKFHPSLRSLLISRLTDIPRLIVVTVEGNAYLPLLRRAKFLAVYGHSASMAHDLSLSCEPRLSGSVAFGGVLIYGAPAGSVAAGGIALV
jgi:hypothetical protein